MANKTKIQWTDATWNIAVGCTKVDEDCKFCYMYRQGDRYGYDAKTVTKTKKVFNLPLTLKVPSKIFTSSLTDFFHEDIDSFRDEAWDIIRRSPHHTFQILTKRPERIKQCLPVDWNGGWKNVWLGTSVGCQKAAEERIPLLFDVPAFIKFLSIEPLYGPMDITNKGINDGYNFPTDYDNGRPIEWADPGDSFIGIDWVIIGGESGNATGKHQYRPCNISWIESIINQCRFGEVSVFVKQLGSHLAKEMNLKDRLGGDPDEWPENLRVREFPIV